MFWLPILSISPSEVLSGTEWVTKSIDTRSSSRYLSANFKSSRKVVFAAIDIVDGGDGQRIEAHGNYVFDRKNRILRVHFQSISTIIVPRHPDEECTEFGKTVKCVRTQKFSEKLACTQGEALVYFADVMLDCKFPESIKAKFDMDSVFYLTDKSSGRNRLIQLNDGRKISVTTVFKNLKLASDEESQAHELPDSESERVPYCQNYLECTVSIKSQVFVYVYTFSIIDGKKWALIKTWRLPAEELSEVAKNPEPYVPVDPREGEAWIMMPNGN
jgi:hypothetical protein